MSMMHVSIVDADGGQLLEAKVHLLDGGGRPVFPENVVRKVGPGLAGFYTRGEFSVELPPGYCTIAAERGTEYEPFETTLHLDAGSSASLEIRLQRWIHLPDRGWYPGNTHVHYDEKEGDPDSRLLLDPDVHDLRVTAISVLQRGDLAYATNKYPVGPLSGFSSTNHVVDCGQETRHNSQPWEIGYGHVIFLQLMEAISPVSRGLLVDGNDPDYPPLTYACDAAKQRGGVVIWCHNGGGMEFPVAAVLGKVDAINLFDPYWVVPEEYSVWYHILNCGVQLPASTGSDWYICSNNRVYVQMDELFSYAAWLKGLQAGRTFITNGPALFLRVNDAQVGDIVPGTPGIGLEVEVSWQSYYPIERVELVHNGQPVDSTVFPDGNRAGEWRTEFVAGESGWLAARLFGRQRDSFFQPVFAHTSPIWIQTGQSSPARKASADYFLQNLAASIDWIRNCGRFNSPGQQAEVLDLFETARSMFGRMP